MLIDTHAHLNFDAYEADSEEVVKRTLENGVWVINVGTQYNTSKKAVEIAEKHEKGVYAAIGLHPIHLNTGLVKMKLDKEEAAFNSREEDFDYEKYKRLTQSEKVVAVGEVGLDYYYKPKTRRKLELFKEKQREALLKQLNLAKELNLPVIFHCRMANQDLIEILSENSEIRPQRAVAHSFVGNLEELQRYLNFGFYIGFNGIIFKTIEGIKPNDSKAVIGTPSFQSVVFEENIKNTPLDKILVETDCPYLTPPPFENQRNEPMYVKYVAEKIAKIKNLRAKRTLFSSSPSFSFRENSAFEEIAKITTENAKNLFKIRAPRRDEGGKESKSLFDF